MAPDTMLHIWLTYAALGLVAAWVALACWRRWLRAVTRRRLAREGFVFLRRYVPPTSDQEASPPPAA